MAPQRSPRSHRRNVRSPNSSFKLPKRSLPTRRARVAEPAPCSQGYRQKLHPIREDRNEDGQENDRRAFADAVDSGGEESDGDVEMYEWDETTLYEHFLSDEPTPQSERDQHIALANGLKTPFAAQSRLLKEYVLQTLTPAAKRIKDVHTILENKVDAAFTEGVLAFNDACKKMELDAMKEEDDFNQEYAAVHRNVTNLFTQLEQAYENRAKLWTDFQGAIDKIADSAIADCEAIPAKFEQVIAKCEKHAKDLEKETTASTKGTEEMIKELFNNL